MPENIFLQMSVVLAITVSIAFVMRLLRQPLIVAYIVAGLITGPLLLNIVNHDHSSFQALAQFGIVLLLFIIGLSFNFEYIQRVGRAVFVGGTIQFLVTALAGFVALKLFGFNNFPALFVAVTITFSSTIIVVKLLVDKKHLETVYGQFVVGLLVTQDLIAVAVLVGLNTLAIHGVWYWAVVGTVGKLLLVLSGVWLLSNYLLPRVMGKIATSGEMLFIFTIAWCFGVASLVYLAGFGVEMGAVIAGISLGSSPYQREISSRLRPLRDFFIVLFFIVLGSELQLADITAVLGPGLVLSAFVLVVEPMILYIVMRRMGYKRRNAFLAGVTAAQVSEFGFILIFKGQELGYLHGSELALLTLVALITIVISSYLITYNEQLYEWLRPILNKLGKEEGVEVPPTTVPYQVWIVGYHRIGWKICDALAKKKIKFAVIDFNPSVIKKLSDRNIPGYFGDVADVEFLESLPFENAELIISTIPDAADQITFFRAVRKVNASAMIIGNLHHAQYLPDLYAAGANYVMLTHLLGGQWISDVLLHKPWTKQTFGGLRREQKEEMKLRFTMKGH